MAKRTIESCYANSLKINRQNYEQESPFYSLKSVVELKNGETFDEIAEYNRLKGIVDPALQEIWDKSRCDLAGVRIRIIDGKEYPSVTSILGPDTSSIKTQIPMAEYAKRGCEIERIILHFIAKGEWVSPTVPLQGLEYDTIKYKEFFEKYKDVLEFPYLDSPHKELYHKRLVYSGEIDLLANVGNIKSILDWKTGGWGWEQLIAYWQGLQDESIQQLAVADLKNCVLEVLDPTSQKARYAWEKFLIKRGEFRARFGK